MIRRIAKLLRYASYGHVPYSAFKHCKFHVRKIAFAAQVIKLWSCKVVYDHFLLGLWRFTAVFLFDVLRFTVFTLIVAAIYLNYSSP